MRACKCGGLIRQHHLTMNRDAWTCNSCGRYEVVSRNISPDIAARAKELIRIFEGVDPSGKPQNLATDCP
jgi:ribosomal protein L32